MAQGHFIKEACVLLDKFRADRRCPDALQDLQNVDDPPRKFVLDVVSGCIEHKKMLDVVVNAFYGQNRNWLSKSDRNQFVIVCYLVTFALDELGLQEFGNIVETLGIKKMHLFLNFFFSNLTSWIQEEWSGVYEADFVEKQWILPLLGWRPEINILMDQLAAKISRRSQVKKAKVKTTQPQEFTLTKPKPRPRPRPLPQPELIPQQEKFKPVPKSTYTDPNELQILEEIKEKNHEKAEDRLYEANKKQFRCVNPEKSEHTKKVIAQIEQDLDSKLKFNSFHSSGLPPSIKADSCSVKLNNAAILRREALNDRQVEEELQRIERLLQGAREPSSFLQWQREMLERDLQEKLPMIERRRLEARIGGEEAALVRQRITERNQKAAQLKKEETAQLMQKYAEKRMQEEKELRDLVRHVAEGHKNSKAAKEKIQKLKQNIVKEVSEQSQELLRQALEEQQEELCRKYQIIREIHSIESLPRIRPNNFRDTETAGHELLGEMSLAELKERLALLRQAERAEQEERRGHILEEKQRRKQEMLEKLDTIELHRRVLAKAAANRKEEKKAKQEFLQQVVAQDETVLALRKKLEEKKLERKRLKQNEKSQACKRTTAHTGTHSEVSTNRAGSEAVSDAVNDMSVSFCQESLKVQSWEELERSLARYIQDDSPS
ncbi:cilia- and flagella-associated protein 99 isoform X2 [Kryptolebias marmoratus]|uniref:cilia- and flagella-associated protein 99 isoform X2 n=1 Tax=Kryptolebias marmoratus TaxID=37003 RepID=UPI0018AC96BE|nr:cilia- and flagella-associated protein 99 isoform X2 [Kryptolebias marmoratus]